MWWPFKKKREEELTEEQLTEEQLLYRKIHKYSTPMDIIENNANPFCITRSYHLNDEANYYFIEVYNLKSSRWEAIDQCSQSVLGISKNEFFQVMKEYYGLRIDIIKGVDGINKAIEIIEKFRPYYETYHTPRALMERLSCYDEGGFPPPPYMIEKALKEEVAEKENVFHLVS